jgi:predicted transcriptional regulator
MFDKKQFLENNRRDRILILSDILSNANHGIGISELICRVGLSSTQTNKYMPLLLKSQLLETSVEKSRLLYKTTDKGKRFLEKTETLRKLIG